MDRVQLVQRCIGGVLSAFCLVLLIVNPFGRASVGEPAWIVTDWVTVAAMVLTGLTAWKMFRGARAVQILCFVVVGVVALADSSQTVGLAILNTGFIMALFYGWYRTVPLPKVVITSLLFFTLVFIFDKSTTNNNLVATGNWLVLFTILDGIVWALHWAMMSDAMLVAKSYKNELDKKERDNAT